MINIIFIHVNELPKRWADASIEAITLEAIDTEIARRAGAMIILIDETHFKVIKSRFLLLDRSVFRMDELTNFLFATHTYIEALKE